MIYNLKSGTVEVVTPRRSNYDRPRFSPDGRLIIYTNKVGKTNQIFRIDLDGKNEKQLTRGKQNKYLPLL